MAYYYYACNGFCHTPSADDPRYGIVEVVLYNPTPRPAEVRMKVYFEDRPPVTIAEPVHVKAETNALLVMPDMDPALFTNCGHWGAQYESTTPLLINSICLDGLEHPNPSYRGGVQSVMGTRLDTLWHYADGVFLDWVAYYNGDMSKAPFPFNELEHYYFLNPNPAPAHIKMTLQYRNLEHVTLDFTAPAERLLKWSTFEKLPPCEPFGVKIESDQPIATSYVRYIYGLKGLDEWGMHVHFALAGTPGPIK